MDIAEKIEDAKQSDALLLIVFYTDCAAAKIRYFSMSYIILLNNIRLFNFFVSVYYD